METKNSRWYVDPSLDPIEDMLEVYDQIVGDYLKISKNGNELLISTGLRQVPFTMKKFYYRLKIILLFKIKLELSI